MITLLVLGIGLYIAMSRALEKEALDSAKSLAAQAERLIGEGAGENDQNAIGLDLSDPMLAQTLARGDFYLEVRDRSGAVASRSPDLHGQSLVISPARGDNAANAALIRTIHGIGPVLIYTSVLHRNGQVIGLVSAGRSLSETYASVHKLRSMLLAVWIIALAAALVGGWWLAGKALRPVDRITRAAQLISAGALSSRLALQGPDDELHRLAQAFDDMLERLGRAFDRERQFTADVAHELRTPLTILRGEIDVALRRPRDAEEYRLRLFSLRGEVARLSRLVTNLLQLAHADAGSEVLRNERIDVRMLLERVSNLFAARAAEHGIELHLNGPADGTIIGDEDRLAQAISNLIDNALRHTRSGGRIKVRWRLSEHAVLIEVVDTGTGIAQEHLANVFQRFYRADNHRSREDGGAGLGLAITQSIAEAHGGTVSVESRLLHGTTFKLSLPSDS